MKYRRSSLLLILLLSVLVTSCSSSKKIAYFQYSGSENQQNVLKAKSYEARIKPKDLLNISVVSSEPTATKNYNLIVPLIAEENVNLYSQPSLQNYLVENDGSIDFPTLGKLQVAGLTRAELETEIQKRIRSAFNEEIPVITIRISNYQVNVLGEVNIPGRYPSLNERMTILEALAKAGDLTVYGRRDNIKVLREHADGSKEYILVNLNDQNVIYSPAYYLEQNDIVYVEPNKSRARTSGIGAAETLSITVVSTLISIAGLVINILR